MKSKLVVIAFILLASLGYAQTNEINGKVIDTKSGSSLPGVNVRVKMELKVLQQTLMEVLS